MRNVSWELRMLWFSLLSENGLESWKPDLAAGLEVSECSARPDEIRTSLEAMEGFYGCTSCDLGRLGKWLKGDKKAGRWLTGYFNVLSQTGVGHLVTERLHGESVSRNAQVRDFAVCSGGNCPCATFGQSSGMRRRYQGRWQSKLSCSTSWGKVFAIVSPLVV